MKHILMMILIVTPFSNFATAQQPAPPTTQELRDTLRDQINRNRAVQTGNPGVQHGQTGKDLRDYRAHRQMRHQEIRREREALREETLRQQEQRRQQYENMKDQRQEFRDETLEERRGLHDQLLQHRREVRENRQ